MRARPGPVEIVEVFDVGTSGGAFQTTPPAEPEPRRRRTSTVLAVLALGGLVVTAMLWPSPDKATEPVPTTVPRPTVPTDSTTPHVPEGFRLIPQAPPGYQLLNVMEGRMDEISGVTELWFPPFASFGETATWTMIQARRGAEPPPRGDRRVQIGDIVGVLGDDLGVRSRTFTLDSGWTIQMWARVRSDQWFIDNAPYVSIVDGEIVFPGYGLHHGAYTLKIDSAESGGAVWWFGPTFDRLSYAAADGRWLNAIVSPPALGARKGLNEFLLYRTLKLVDGTEARFAQGLLDDSQNSMVMQFERNDQLVTIVGPDLASAAALADSMRLGSEAEWRELHASAGGQPQPEFALRFEGRGGLLGSGTLTTGASWTATGQVDTTGQHLALQFDVAPDARRGEAESEAAVDQRVPDRPDIVPVANERATFLAALLPGPANGAVLRVAVDGQPDPLEVPLADPTAPIPVASAVVAFSETGDWQAEIVAADGMVLAALPEL